MSLTEPTLPETAWKHKGAIGIVLIVFTVGLLLAFWFGTQKAAEWADSKYLQEREESTRMLAVIQDQNDKLRMHNDAQAQLFKQIDSASDVKKAEDFAKRQEERKQKENEIQNADPATSLSGLCNDARSAGFKLSFCG
jgi:hypothetical protein